VIPGSHHDIRLASPEDSHCEGAPDPFKGFSDSLHQVLVKTFLDEVGQDLCICFGTEYVSLSLEFRPQSLVILDYAVMHHHKVIFAVTMGMGICSGRGPMGSPAGMAKPNMAFNAQHLFNNFSQVGEFALGPVLYQPAVLQIYKACGVVPSVLKAFEAFEQDGNNFPGTDITNYAAHISPKRKMIIIF
jgi:hypothetical protein